MNTIVDAILIHDAELFGGHSAVCLAGAALHTERRSGGMPRDGAEIRGAAVIFGTLMIGGAEMKLFPHWRHFAAFAALAVPHS